MPQAARIFVSHASEDSAWCQQFVDALSSVGADAWFDEHSLGHGVLMDEIEREMRERPIFIIVLSPHAVVSRWVQREMQAAIILQDEQPGRIIIPVLAEKADIPLFWRVYKCLNGRDNTALAAVEAAGRVAHVLALVPAAVSVAPVPPEPSETAEQAWERGKGLRTQGRQQEALSAIERAVALDPKSATYWNTKGLTLCDLRRYDEALSAFEQALALNTKLAKTWGNKGLVLTDLKRYDEALNAFEQALTLDPKNANIWNTKGLTLCDLRRYDEALEAYEQALSLNPKLTFAWYAKGNALRDLERYDEALEAYEHTLALNPKRAFFWTVKGAALCDLQHYSGALEAFNHALSLDPKYMFAWDNKIALLDQMGRKAEADEARRQRDAALKGS